MIKKRCEFIYFVLIITVLFGINSTKGLLFGEIPENNVIIKTVYSEKKSNDNKKSDIIFKDKKIINLSISVLEVRPSETIIKLKPQIFVEDGQSCSLRFGKRFRNRKYSTGNSIKLNGESVNIMLIPRIVKDKGVEISIKTRYFYLKDSNMSGKKRKPLELLLKRSVFTRNDEEIAVDLLENKREKKKIVLLITPFIKIIPGPSLYRENAKYKLSDPIFIMNNELISNQNGSPSFISEGLTSKNRTGKKFLNSYIACVLKNRFKGTIFLSVKKFKGSKKIGILNNKKLKFRYNDNNFELISLESILPVKGKWIVFGKYISDRDIRKEKSLDLSPLVGDRGGIVIVSGKDFEKVIL